MSSERDIGRGDLKLKSDPVYSTSIRFNDKRPSIRRAALTIGQDSQRWLDGFKADEER